MSIRLRLFLSYLVLIVSIALAGFWGLERLTRDLRDALGQTAQDVGRQVVSVLRQRAVEAAALPADEDIRRALEHARDAVRDAHVDTTETLKNLRITREQRPGEPPRIRIDGVPVPDDVDLEEIEARLATLRDLPQLRIQLAEVTQRGPVVLNLHGLGADAAIAVPQTTVDAALAQFGQRVAFGLGGLALLASALAVAFAWRIARPLRQLADSAERLGDGDLGVQAPQVRGPREIRQSIDAFNAMSLRLREYERDAQRSRADRELAELGEIGRGLAHSLRNPLHALGLTLDALAQQAADPHAASAHLVAGRAQLTRLDEALRGFLALSAGAAAHATPVRVADVIQDVMLETAQRGGDTAFAFAPADIALPAVAAELRVMLHTLIVNAVEASPPGGTVHVDMQRNADGRIVVAVRDEGGGVSPDIATRLFQPHVTDKPTGAGMGLYLARRLAQSRYDGDIHLQPAEGGGTLARLHLAARREAA